jgi:hypothetical protein
LADDESPRVQELGDEDDDEEEDGEEDAVDEAFIAVSRINLIESHVFITIQFIYLFHFELSGCLMMNSVSNQTLSTVYC